MIVSASRRTDIPCWYSDWFFRRLREGYALARNPMNPHQISRVSLSPDAVDGFVFWTKNPAPMLPWLDELSSWPYYFQFTLTPYGRDIEAGLPDKFDALIPGFLRLSEAIGPERVLWRYDPILFDGRWTVEAHLEQFDRMARLLRGTTDSCTASFLDHYRGISQNLRGLRSPTADEQRQLAAGFARIARANAMRLQTCAEAIDLSDFGVGHARCIDAERMGRIARRPLAVPKDKHQRPECGCAASVDIGAYDTCRNGCRYCYANHRPGALAANLRAYDPTSPLLVGRVAEGDVIRDREMKPQAATQTSLFDGNPDAWGGTP